MAITLNSRQDFTLDTFAQVSRLNTTVTIGHDAIERMQTARKQFLNYIDDDSVTVYGVTSGYGQQAHLRFSPEERKRHAARPPTACAVSFGPPLPDRVVRGIIFARLTNLITGYAAITPDIAIAASAMLADGKQPEVPLHGNGGAGEILPLGHLFQQVAHDFTLAEKDTVALINGSPCATALLADATVTMTHRLDLALDVFALAWEAFKAPMTHIDPALDDLWGDPHETWALQQLRDRLDQAGSERRAYQAPVSYRVLPRCLGQFRRAVVNARELSSIALAAITDNPVYLPPDDQHPTGRAISTGGYHNAPAAPALDTLTAICADLCTIAERQASKMLDGGISKLPDQLLTAENDDRYLGTVGFAAVGFVEHARQMAQPTLLPGSESGGYGQNDLATTTFPAWEKANEAGRCLDACLAMLAVVASQALYVTKRPAAGNLEAITKTVRDTVSPLDEARVMGPEYARLSETFRLRCEGA